jgi:hypothetical protein
MGRTFLNDIHSKISEIKKSKKTVVFSIASTKKKEDKAYLAPIRINKDFVLFGCLIFDQDILLPLLNIIDGIVDIILVDSEKNIPLSITDYNDNKTEHYKTIGYVKTGNLSKICFHHVVHSKLFEFKPNDLTVNATWVFLSQRLHFLSGKKISILGAGNIGSKLALKLVECGAEVHLYRRDAYKGYQITHGLNLIKSENTVAEIQFHQEIIEASFMADVLIGATDGYPIIDDDIIKSVSQNCLIVDLGKNNLTKEAIKIASQHSLEVYRTDVTPSLEGYVYELLKMNNILEVSYGIRKLDYCNIVGGGYFGGDGDIVVDNIYNPKQIIGMCGGDGLLKKELCSDEQKKINKLKKEFNIDL